MKLIFTLIMGFLVFNQPAFSGDDHDEKAHSHEESEENHGDEKEEEAAVSNVGEDKGVLEASKAKGFKLTVEANKHLGIKTAPLQKEGNTFLVPKSAIAAVKRERFIYTFNGGFYKPVEVSIVRSSGANAFVKSEHDEITGLIAVQGVHFLRNIEVDVFSGEEGGHHH